MGSGNAVAATGDDTLVIDGRVIGDMADGDWFKFNFPNDLVTVKVGKDGNTLYAKNSQGLLVAAELRLLRGSADDKHFSSRLAEQQSDLAAFSRLDGTFVKRVGDGAGDVSNDTYPFSGGVFQKVPEAKSNAEGDTEQSVVVYLFTFLLNPLRTIQ